MDFVDTMPVVLSIPSYLTFFEDDNSIWYFLYTMNNTQRKWNNESGEVRQMGKTVHRTLRMEGIEDVNEEKLRNEKNTSYGRVIVFYSIEWNNLFGMNVPEQE
ncbi:hypothetical protein BLNAU_7534 [Blattamonas nauphoetae]|uniref:Uncharacterized protein n=1 Tax=Blattamonas nauphoetae TaxID=2049346 RepID=A0ABQ9Y1M1_9EUKA|nr:hypothetical protein BLNAU_7534 [Blattamonas nauphoetae]